ncbi:MAG: hypothetical protein GYB65_20020 [Chloroflexi bacterium]|nr:hypothetical protein [Chloroflexota bacterium]
MNTLLLEQSATHLTRHTRRWDRRLRLVRCLVWGPRSLIFSLAVGVMIALMARLRPWLLPEEIALITGGVAAASLVSTLVLIWVWPRSTTTLARYFDRRFDLKERISTALELAGGTIPLPISLGERQLSDAVGAANRVNTARVLPLRVRVWEVLGLVLLGGLFAFLLLADNPRTDELLAEREREEAIADQIAELENLIEQIEADDSLSQAEKDALIQPLEEALEILEQPDVTLQEAGAAMAAAQRELEDIANGLPPDQEVAYQEAGDALAGSELTSDLGAALQEPDLDKAAEAINDLADRLDDVELSETEREALANEMDALAEQVEETNPDLAERFEQAADALREGDVERAQEILRTAAEEQEHRNEAAREAIEQAQNSLSQNTEQQGLRAEDLERAAEQVSPVNPGAAQQMRQAAEDMREGDTDAAQQSLDSASQQLDAGQQAAQQALDGAQQPLDESVASETEDLANELDAASDALQQANPPAAEQLEAAAQELREGDIEAAQQRLSDAADALSQQASIPPDSDLMQTVQQAQQQLQDGQQDLANAGSDAEAQPQPSGGEGQPQDGIPGEMQGGSSQGQANTENAAPSDQLPASSGSTEDGEGPGGEGVENTTSGPSESASSAVQNAPDGEPGSDSGGSSNFESNNASDLLGGESDTIVELDNNTEIPTDGQMRTGDFMELLPADVQELYREADYDFDGAIDDAYSDNRLPIDQRGIVGDYLESVNGGE